jgi:protein TonB
MRNYFILFIGLLSFQVSYAVDIQQDTTNNEMVYDMPEHMPQYPGGADAMEHFIFSNIKYPQKAKEQNLQGKVYVQFIVEKDGSISDINIRRGAHDLLDKEAIRVIKMMPNWKPGSMRGRKVRVRYTLPITFHLN